MHLLCKSSKQNLKFNFYLLVILLLILNELNKTEIDTNSTVKTKTKYELITEININLI